jgi:hypothetical protein
MSWIAPLKNVPEYAVLTDRYQIEALNSLGASTIESVLWWMRTTQTLVCGALNCSNVQNRQSSIEPKSV